MKKILIPVTNHATLGDTDQTNGTYSPEITHAIHVFMENGIEYDIASIKGGKAPLYGTDIEDDSVNDNVLADEGFQNRINNTIPVTQINIDDYDAVFYPGGFGKESFRWDVLHFYFQYPSLNKRFYHQRKTTIYGLVRYPGIYRAHAK